MISINKLLIGASAFIGYTFAAYTNTSSSITTNNATFSSIKLVDSYTNDVNCSDPSHWFLIEAQVSVPQGNSSDIYMSVPDAFTSFPSESFDLLYNSAVVGTVYNNNSNIFTVSVNDNVEEAGIASFNFLAKLTSDAKELITSPKDITYEFNVSSGNVFDSTISYIAKDIESVSTNGGIFSENNTAWFTADVPLSMVAESFAFEAESNNGDYEFNTELTTFEIVTAMDAFNNPTKFSTLTAVDDGSSSAKISCSISTQISGGQYIRITYYSDVLSESSITNLATFSYTNAGSTLQKRGTLISEVSQLFSESEANIEDVSSVTTTVESSSSSIISSSSIGSAISTSRISSLSQSSIISSVSSVPTSTSKISVQSVSSVNKNTTSSSQAQTSILSTKVSTNESYYQTVTSSDTSPAQATATNSQSSLSSNNENEIYVNGTLESYTIITTTEGAIITEIGEYVAVGTLSSSAPVTTTPSTSNAAAIFSSETIMGEIESTLTIGADVTTYDSLLGGSVIKTATNGNQSGNEVTRVSSGAVETTISLGADVSIYDSLLGGSTIKTATSDNQSGNEVTQVSSGAVETTISFGADVTTYDYLLGGSPLNTAFTSNATSVITEVGEATVTSTAQVVTYTSNLGGSVISSPRDSYGTTITGANKATVTEDARVTAYASLLGFSSINSDPESRIETHLSNATVSYAAQVTSYTEFLGGSAIATSIQQENTTTINGHFTEAATKTATFNLITSSSSLVTSSIKLSSTSSSVHTTGTIQLYEASADKLKAGVSVVFVGLLTLLF
ncbi:hypothetical protein KAFR_0A08600 [Kazachstania africana CBS 2517]|uniref:Uncharacterized protein n=1 Tax=Kazachstania africana (strain ATCC 22294 / BCRC 22015 / CBS 2517 / CECT 1963 / NBRC 1671 / NRRL Y-8276) TaxID=1071382 RepID=H2APJ4_KAZAF|nr:hypothetical protein KAFR_0A08600 [Kazachstania africana CBS 2517]CCF56294.1 hypothetical protein KAFR_0A08600 [Kazachstania africana CBS 2517]